MSDLNSAPNADKHLHNQSAGLLQVLGSRGSLEELTVFNDSASIVFLQFHNQTTPPTNGEVPDRACIPLAAGAYYESDTRRAFSDGLWIGISSTKMTFTAAGDDVYLDARGEY